MRRSFYPVTPSPENQPSLQPSRAFRRSVYPVIFSIFLFCLLYVAVILLSISLLVGGVYAEIAIASSKVNVITIILGGGIMVLEVLFLVFFIRFLFATNRNNNRQRLEVTPEDQPRLYEFIRQLAEDIHAPLPHRVFLVPNVTVGISYGSGFWNIFWPVRKNLEIGLGLVNSLSVGELKAVLAHEFGHFSRRNTRLGNYAYTVNRVLYHLAYEQDRWDQPLDEWVAAGGLFGLFARSAQAMTYGARALLRWAYGGLHKQYLVMGREIELHADRMAISIAGHKAMVSALRRLELGAQAYEHCTTYLNQLAELEKKTDDIYASQRTVLKRLAHQYGLYIAHDLPQVLGSKIAKTPVKSRIIVHNQWAFHPSRQERERNILFYSVAVPDYPQSAWKLLKNPPVLRRKVTHLLYEIGFPGQSFRALSSDNFATYVEQEEGQYQLSSVYQGFYDGRTLQPFVLKEAITEKESVSDLTFEMIYNEANYRKIADFFANQNDFETLKNIQSGAIDTHYFDFGGRKCSRQEIGTLIRLLNSDVARQRLWLTELDQQAFLWHYRRAQEAGQVTEYVARYQMVMSLQEAYQNFSEDHHQLDYWQEQLGTTATWGPQEIHTLAKELSNVEVGFKSHLRVCVAANRIEDMLPESRRQEVIPYLRSDQAYYLKVSDFDEEAFMRFTSLVYDLWTATRQAYKQSLKSLTDYQLRLQVTEELPDLRLQG